MTRLLVVEDDFALRLSLTALLEAEGFTVAAVASAEEARRVADAATPDLVILDWSLPGEPGVDLLRAWRGAGRSTPVIMLTARDAVADRVDGLSSGADDYLVKPFATEELVARIRVQLRRGDAGPVAELLRVGERTVDLAAAVVAGPDGRRDSLTRQEAQTLAYLAARRGRAVPREELLREVWGYRNTAVRTRAIDNAIYRLRSKLEEDPAAPRHLVTVRGVGYRLEG